MIRSILTLAVGIVIGVAGTTTYIYSVLHTDHDIQQDAAKARGDISSFGGFLRRLLGAEEDGGGEASTPKNVVIIDSSKKASEGK